MIIKQFLLSVACYDEQPPSGKDVVEAIWNGMMERSGVCSAIEGTAFAVDCPDPDLSLNGRDFDREILRWDQAANAIINGHD